MITRRGFGAAALIGAMLVGVTSCRAGESLSYRYKLTIEVETPGGLRTAYRVIEVQFYGTMKGFEALSGGSVKARGQAVALDLPNGKTLFVLLSSATSADWAGYVHRRQFPKQSIDFPSAAEYSKALMSDRTVFPVERWVEMPNDSKRDDYPMLVTFKDANDPATVQLVDPDDLAASFGAGYRLRGLTVQVTDEAVTTGIEKMLPWWKSYLDSHFDGSSPAIEDLTTNSLSARLSARSFSTELSK
jgi:hypothetical protein